MATYGRVDKFMEHDKETITLGSKDNLHPGVAMIVQFENFDSQVVVFDTYCANPDCACKNVTLWFHELVGDAVKDQLFEIQINVETWELKGHKIFKKDIDCQGMILNFFQNLNDDIKKRIKNRFKLGKKFGDLPKEDLDYSKLSKKGLLYYSEVFDSVDFTSSYLNIMVLNMRFLIRIVQMQNVIAMMLSCVLL